MFGPSRCCPARCTLLGYMQPVRNCHVPCREKCSKTFICRSVVHGCSPSHLMCSCYEGWAAPSATCRTVSLLHSWSVRAIIVIPAARHRRHSDAAGDCLPSWQHTKWRTRRTVICGMLLHTAAAAVCAKHIAHSPFDPLSSRSHISASWSLSHT
jgi:hypothetical protein